MAFDNQEGKLNFSHPNFNGGSSAVGLQFDGVFPTVKEYDETGHYARGVQEQPKDNGGWTTRKHCDGKFDALLVNGDGYEVALSNGAPVVKLNGTQVYP